MRHDSDRKTSARVLAHSINPRGESIITLEVTMHRFVLAEFNTHRVFSRNSESSRAVPLSAKLDEVATNVAFPVVWPGKAKTMQGGAPLHPDECRQVWQEAAEAMVTCAKRLDALGLHKSYTNRLLEPFTWHTLIVTSTEWDNFFTQRCDAAAQPEMRLAAEAMQEAIQTSSGQCLEWGDWHLPLYFPEKDAEAIQAILAREQRPGNFRELSVARDISAGRCARVSYRRHDGSVDAIADYELACRLKHSSPPHYSPFEHQARADNRRGSSGNFRGSWYQHRDYLA